jgi:molybdate-binding protein
MDPTERALKQITTTQIEEAISKTVSELVGKEYAAEVLNIDFNPIQNSLITDTVEIRLRLSREWVESAIKKLEQEEASVELKHEQVQTRLSNARPSREPD